jgi:hypothetical protein
MQNSNISFGIEQIGPAKRHRSAIKDLQNLEYLTNLQM